MGSVIKLLARVINRFNSLVTLSLANQTSMSGNAFSLRKRFDILAAGSIDIVLDPGVFTKEFLVFLPISFNGKGGPILIDIYSGVTANSDGTPLPLFNRNFALATLPETTAQQDPTGVVITGLTPIEILLPSDGTPAAASSGSETDDDLVANLDPTKKMLIRLTNTDTATATVGVKADFFEV